MVNYSKYLFTLAFLFLAIATNAQSNLVNRDKEICRITLENYLKQWDDEVILNRIEGSKATYSNNTLSFEIEAPNAQVILNAQRGLFKENDEDVLDMFYDQEMIALQQERLLRATSQFLKDFHTYLPKLETNEHINFIYQVGDKEKKDKEGKILRLKGAAKRQYNLNIQWKMSDVKALASGDINNNEFAQRALISK